MDPNPDLLDAGWSIRRSNDFTLSGRGDSTLVEMTEGEYRVVWERIQGWLTPLNDTLQLTTGNELTFTGDYTAITVPDNFVQISAGGFAMGAQQDEPGAEPDEYPRHQVTLSRAFAILSTEVTNFQYLTMAQWAINQGYASASSASLRDDLGGMAELLDLDDGESDIEYTNGLLHTNRPNHPVKEVSWFGAAAYCDWLNLHRGLPMVYDHVTWANSPNTMTGYRLPTEAEWEYVCRAGSETAFANGNINDENCNDTNLDRIGWYCGDELDWTSPVGLKQANAWGVYDMHGNLYEWCNDWYSSTIYSTTSPLNPTGPVTGTQRVLKGGDWPAEAIQCRSANRQSEVPSYGDGDMGFRAIFIIPSE
ncbi:MAG: formylglycine-generating enzyme family protein [bacterium]|nr:formylglycine-generating enzyme family protein [bacterium]